jgi:putative spermidine/putrescine transport system substrate-binding protein
MQKLGKGEGQVDIVAWAGYIERGATDKNFDWVTDFEKKTGCKVNVKTAGTSDEMVALMNEGGFDLVTASGDASTRLIRGKKVQPINVNLIPSYKNIDPRLQKAPWHYENNTHYGVPYQWGWNVLMYNTKVFKDKPPTSWNVVFEEQTLPDGKSNKGRVQAFDGPIYIADAALYLMKKNPALGIKDPYELNEAQYKAALDLLRGSARSSASTGTTPSCRSTTSPTRAWWPRLSWQFQANILGSKKRPIATVVPTEGATGWADSTMMHAEAKHPNCAYMWLEHSLNPKLQGDLSAWFGSVPAVPAACKGNKLLGDEGCARQGYNDFDKISFWKTPTTQCKSQNNKCVPYHKWVSDYIAVLGGR